ncbi:glycosyltransferase family 4 protein [Dorcoceras hygrometricum]|uniref:Glycosyltransferase family 4 protein n=1 Tax=Dorcoceras hygrometricum TaxID=472368 RepID=A0A2Z7BL64_9LAMI|nr:glycosyltransferase family 4 protein [Dorcoceras hygrometricum]
MVGAPPDGPPTGPTGSPGSNHRPAVSYSARTKGEKETAHPCATYRACSTSSHGLVDLAILSSSKDHHETTNTTSKPLEQSLAETMQGSIENIGDLRVIDVEDAGSGPKPPWITKILEIFDGVMNERRGRL